MPGIALQPTNLQLSDDEWLAVLTLFSSFAIYGEDWVAHGCNNGTGITVVALHARCHSVGRASLGGKRMISMSLAPLNGVAFSAPLA
jgi:hypothetical protein